MAAPTTTARSRTPKALDADDAMAMRAAELAAWARRNVRAIAIVAGVVLVVALAVLGMRYQKQRTADRAAAQWVTVQESAAGPAAIPQLSAFANSFSGTPEAAEARLIMASMYLDQNQPQKAVEEARRVVDAGGPMAFQGRMMLGQALAAAGQRQPAVQAFLEAADNSELKYERLEARSQAALVNEQAGQWGEAARIYRTMLADVKEGTSDRAVVELRAAEAESHLVQAR